MIIVYTAAALIVVVGGVLYLKNAVFSDTGVRGVQEKKTDLVTGLLVVIIAALILLAAIALYQQINAAVGENTQDPFILTWIRDLLRSIFTGGLPQLK